MSARCVTVRSVAFSTLSALALGGCGLTYSRLPEIWDETDPDATYHMEVQVKKAIYCELRQPRLKSKPISLIARENKIKELNQN